MTASPATLRITLPLDVIADFCRRWRISRLEVFGSVLREDFRPDSDLDLVGKHVRYGEKTLDWFIEDFVTNHLSGHVKQIKRCLELVG